MQQATHDEVILKMQANLLKIKLTGKAPVNLTQYCELGLVTIRHKYIMTPSGNTEKILDRLVLTQKGKRILAAVQS